ncbi:carbohydrate sulfotransferase 11-like [Amphiura filiformis]|uniref:carbohydrate sulfotransferase 11-like n=1 Tax=Amphiura filiformis TaxID=82378 RepID=UPI003B20F728
MTGGNNRRLICTSFCLSSVIVMLCVVYMVWSSEDPFGQVTYYAVSADDAMQYVWKNVGNSYVAAPCIDKTSVSLEGESCKSSHPVNITFMRSQEMVQKRRRESLTQVCVKYHIDQTDSPELPSAGLSLLLEEYRHIYTTSKFTLADWDHVFDILSHFTNCATASEKIKVSLPGFKKEDQFTLQNFTTFMVSRHPFSRLLSAYIFKVGPDATAEQVTSGNYEKLRKKILISYPSKTSTKKDIPDFCGFISYILDNDYFDDVSWMENYKLLSPCNLPYDIIGKFETFENDANFILQSTGAQCLVDSAVFDRSILSGFINEDILLKYYQTLPKEAIKILYQRYRLDFLLFDYTFEITVDGEMLRFPD